MDIDEGCQRYLRRVAWWTLFGRSDAKVSLFAHIVKRTPIVVALEKETDTAALSTVATHMNQSGK
jgi:hypothetical protein